MLAAATLCRSISGTSHALTWARGTVPDPEVEKTRSQSDDSASHLPSWKADLALCSAEDERSEEERKVRERRRKICEGAWAAGKDALQRRDTLKAFRKGTAWRGGGVSVGRLRRGVAKTGAGVGFES